MDYNYLSATDMNTALFMVKRVVKAAKEYFPDCKVEAVWETREGSRAMSSPVLVQIHTRSDEDFDAALDTLDKFDDEWWLNQEIEYHKLIGVFLE